jgi:hypothetical protein
MRKSMILAAMLPALATAALADPVTPDMQKIVIDHFRRFLVLPDFSIWHFDEAKPNTLGGTLVCGTVNYQNSNRRYQGFRPFYMVIRNGAFSEGGITGNFVEDGLGRFKAAYELLCKGR